MHISPVLAVHTRQKIHLIIRVDLSEALQKGQSAPRDNCASGYRNHFPDHPVNWLAYSPNSPLRWLQSYLSRQNALYGLHADRPSPLSLATTSANSRLLVSSGKRLRGSMPVRFQKALRERTVLWYPCAHEYADFR